MLDAKYKREVLNKVINEQWQHLPQEEHERLLSLLRIFEDQFDGTLGTWNSKPVHLELKYYATPVCLCLYAVLNIQEEMFRKEIKLLVSIHIFEHTNNSEWEYSYFSQPKMTTNWVWFMSNLQHLNNHLKRKPYPMQKNTWDGIKMRRF